MGQLILAIIVIVLVVAIIGAIATGIGMLLGFLWNLIVVIIYFGPIWLPPLILCAIVACLPAVQTWCSSRLYKERGLGDWTSGSETVVSAWRDSKVRWTVYPCVLIIALVWALIPWSILWPGELNLHLFLGFTHAAIEQMYATRSPGAIFCVALPVMTGAAGIELLLRSNVGIRFRIVNAKADENASHLNTIKNQITDEYGKFGIEKIVNYADTYRSWMSANIWDVLHNGHSAKTEYLRLKTLADNELASLKKCLAQYDAVQAAYEAGLVLLRKKRSSPVHDALFAIRREMDSGVLEGLIGSSRWEDAGIYLDEVLAELVNLDKLAESLSDENESGTDKEKHRFEAALKELGLSPEFTKEDVDARRKQFAKIYHPDHASHKGQRENNENRLKTVNEACDYLLSLNRSA